MQPTNSITVFNVFSGVYLEFPEEDVSLLKVGHLPLLKKPKSSCRKCSGRGYNGINVKNFTCNVCLCVQKVLNFDILKKIENKHLS